MINDDCGPAFPSVKTDRQYITDINVHSVGGMSLRDYFAAKAMQAIQISSEASNYEWTAQCAYEMADKMIAERAK